MKIKLLNLLQNITKDKNVYIDYDGLDVFICFKHKDDVIRDKLINDLKKLKKDGRFVTYKKDDKVRLKMIDHNLYNYILNIMYYKMDHQSAVRILYMNKWLNDYR